MLALTILLGQVTMAFSMFAVAVALPNIMHALSGHVSTIHWVMTGFQIARTVPMPAMGWLSSLMGHRNLYITGLLLTVLGTMCCGLAWHLESLISVQEATRAVTGVLVESGLGHGPPEAFAVLGEHLQQTAQLMAYQYTFLALQESTPRVPHPTER